MSLIRNIKSALSLPAIVIMTISLYVEAIPQFLVSVSCWYMVIICSLELLYPIFSLVICFIEGFPPIGDFLRYFLTFAIPIVIGILAFINKNQILTFLHTIREVSKFEWFAMSCAIYFGLKQIACLPSYSYFSNYTSDNNPFP